MSNQDENTKKIAIRVKASDYEKIKARANAVGFFEVSSYTRYVLLRKRNVVGILNEIRKGITKHLKKRPRVESEISYSGNNLPSNISFSEEEDKKTIVIRLKMFEYCRIVNRAKLDGFWEISSYIRFVLLNESNFFEPLYEIREYVANLQDGGEGHNGR